MKNPQDEALSKEDAEKIRKEVAYKKRLAEEAGLDRLFLDVYHRSVRHYPAWFKSDDTKKYIYPGTSEIAERIVKEPSGDTYITEFLLGGRRYKMVSLRRGTFLARDIYYVVELFINGEKVFAVSEKHDLRLRDRHYYTLNIEAYTSENWVNDFRKINEFQDEVEKMMTKEPAEDPELISHLKKSFNINTSEKPVVLSHQKKSRSELLLLILILILVLIVAIVRISPLSR